MPVTDMNSKAGLLVFILALMYVSAICSNTTDTKWDIKRRRSDLPVQVQWGYPVVPPEEATETEANEVSDVAAKEEIETAVSSSTEKEVIAEKEESSIGESLPVEVEKELERELATELALLSTVREIEKILEEEVHAKEVELAHNVEPVIETTKEETLLEAHAEGVEPVIETAKEETLLETHAEGVAPMIETATEETLLEAHAEDVEPVIETAKEETLLEAHAEDVEPVIETAKEETVLEAEAESLENHDTYKVVHSESTFSAPLHEEKLILETPGSSPIEIEIEEIRRVDVGEEIEELVPYRKPEFKTPVKVTIHAESPPVLGETTPVVVELEPIVQERIEAREFSNYNTETVAEEPSISEPVVAIEPIRESSHPEPLVDPRDPDRDSIVGMAEVDYPTLLHIPITSFHCADHPYPGYYADIETRCQVFHICQADGRRFGFLCPIGTVFHQKYLVCDWWYNVNCLESPAFFSINGAIVETPKPVVVVVTPVNEYPVIDEEIQPQRPYRRDVTLA